MFHTDLIHETTRNLEQVMYQVPLCRDEGADRKIPTRVRSNKAALSSVDYECSAIIRFVLIQAMRS